MRTAKVVNGVKHEYYYISSDLRYEKFGTTELWFFYDSDGNPSGVRYKNGNTTTDYYFVCNWRGDVIRIYDGTGAVVANYNYDAWGGVISVTDSNGIAITDPTHIANVNPLRYRGYYFDSETGLYYLRSRYYDPETGRFINGDVIVTVNDDHIISSNVYAYCLNNFTGCDDQSGCYSGWDDAAAIIAGGLISGCTQLATDVLSGSWSGWEAYVGEITGGAVGGLLSLYYPGYAGAIGSGLSTFITETLQNHTGKEIRDFDVILMDSAISAGKGFLLGKFCDKLCSLPQFDKITYSYKNYSSKSSKAIDRLIKGNNFFARRDAFYSYLGNIIPASFIESLPGFIYNIYSAYEQLLKVLVSL